MLICIFFLTRAFDFHRHLLVGGCKEPTNTKFISSPPPYRGKIQQPPCTSYGLVVKVRPLFLLSS